MVLDCLRVAIDVFEVVVGSNFRIPRNWHALFKPNPNLNPNPNPVYNVSATAVRSPVVDE